jgi:multidrug resistance efflux pump
VASRPEPAQPTVVIQRAAAPDAASLAALLQYEGEMRRQASDAELRYFLANETRKIVAYDQMFVLSQARIGEGWHVAAASSLPTIDRNAPLIQAIQRIVAALGKDAPLAQGHDFDALAFAGTDAETVGEYPFFNWRWQPFLDADGLPFAGAIVARSTPLREAEIVRIERVADTAAHSWRALTGGRPVRRLRALGHKEKRGIAVALIGLALVPVQITALAPVEVVAGRPFVIAAPFAGVVQSIAVPPNTPVKAGQLILTFEDVKLRNELALAEEKRAVADARLNRSSSAAFGEIQESREIAINRAEFELADAEFNYARDMLAKSRVTAPRDGVVIYSDRRDWEGRAVNVGEAIVQVADPRDVQFRADLPAKEQMRLLPGDHVRVWLDAQPLWAMEARLDRASYQARMTPENILAFAVNAKPVDGAAPRIGSRGTAKIYGRWVPLSYALLRRPIASLRQAIGF